MVGYFLDSSVSLRFQENCFGWVFSSAQSRFSGKTKLLGTNLVAIDKYAYRIPNPKHTPPKYTKAKVHQLRMNTCSGGFTELRCHPIKSLAATSLPEYVDIHTLLTGYLCP